jgi:hypothetical protein
MVGETREMNVVFLEEAERRLVAYRRSICSTPDQVELRVGAPAMLGSAAL